VPHPVFRWLQYFGPDESCEATLGERNYGTETGADSGPMHFGTSDSLEREHSQLTIAL
jgi:hypothetical protein